MKYADYVNQINEWIIKNTHIHERIKGKPNTPIYCIFF